MTAFFSLGLNVLLSEGSWRDKPVPQSSTLLHDDCGLSQDAGERTCAWVEEEHMGKMCREKQHTCVFSLRLRSSDSLIGSVVFLALLSEQEQVFKLVGCIYLNHLCDQVATHYRIFCSIEIQWEEVGLREMATPPGPAGQRASRVYTGPALVPVTVGHPSFFCSLPICCRLESHGV